MRRRGDIGRKGQGGEKEWRNRRGWYRQNTYEKEEGGENNSFAQKSLYTKNVFMDTWLPFCTINAKSCNLDDGFYRNTVVIVTISKCK